MGKELFLNRVRAGMLEYGFMVVHSGCDHPRHGGYSYTVGLTALDHPELLMAGLDCDSRHYLLNELAVQVRAGRRYRPGDTGSVDMSYDVTLVGPVDADGDFMYPISAVRGIFPDAGPALQAVFPDGRHRLPWQEGYDMDVDQPLLGPVPG